MKKITNISFHLRTDDIKDHRYQSIDDWTDPSKVKNLVKGETALVFPIQTADMGERKYNFLTLLHALIESYMCFEHGISDDQVSGYDMEHTHCDDPGSHQDAPYHAEHQLATDVEAMVSVALGVDWTKYGKATDKTIAKYPKKKA